MKNSIRTKGRNNELCADDCIHLYNCIRCGAECLKFGIKLHLIAHDDSASLSHAKRCNQCLWEVSQC